ncbi:MAG: carboxylesterase family protein [Balneolaceae bacterium]
MIFSAFLKCLFLLLILFAGSVSTFQVQLQQDNQEPRISTENGIIGGFDNSGVYTFKGIPFAQPPEGNLRWKEPQPVQDWDGVLETKGFRNMCMQLPVFGDMNFRASGMSEDCLYLNIWSPAKSADEKLPVLVYYYGGGFIAGDGSEGRYDGESMARNKGIISITVNYRLGIFGFYAHPDLSAESPNNSSGNYGLLDQAKALQWVKDNIAAFGGDPHNITIAGESAGSIAVSALMASPLSRDLIAGAIGESGSILGALPPVSLEEGERNGAAFADNLTAASINELRSLPAEELLQAAGQPGTPRFAPTVDGYFFPKAPLAIFEAGEQADVPLFVGWNSQEMNHRMIMGDDDPNPEKYAEKIRGLYGEHASRVMELYPGSSTDEVLQSATDLAGDRFIAFSTWKWSDLHSKTGSSPVYRYYYAKPRPPMKEKYAGQQPGLAGGMQDAEEPEEESESISGPEGAVHAAEIEYIMGNLHHNDVFAWTEDDVRVSDIFQNYAANFVKNLDPNGAGVPEWSAINHGETPKIIYINEETRLIDEIHRERYRFLDRLSGAETE